MTTKTGYVIARDKHTSLVEFSPACSGCKGCASATSKTLLLDGQFNSEVELELDVRSQWFALLNSLLMPILFAVLGAFVADWLHSSELVGIFLSLCGFTLGLLLCRPLSATTLAIRET